jgi:rod shape-determining protein MreD
VSGAQSRWVIWVSLLCSLMLSILPLPAWMAMAKPLWVPMVVLYWIIALPQAMGMMKAWAMGLLIDVTHGVILGQHAMAMATIAFFMLPQHQRIRNYPLLQQSLVVFIVLGIYQMLGLWLDSVSGRSNSITLFLLPAVTSALLWPWLFILLRDMRRCFSVR